MGIDKEGYDPSEEEEIKTRKELFDHNVNFVVEKFKDNPEGLKKMIESSQEIIDKRVSESLKISEDSSVISQEKDLTMYEIRTFEEALRIIESEQE